MCLSFAKQGQQSYVVQTLVARKGSDSAVSADSLLTSRPQRSSPVPRTSSRYFVFGNHSTRYSSSSRGCGKPYCPQAIIPDCRLTKESQAKTDERFPSSGPAQQMSTQCCCVLTPAVRDTRDEIQAFREEVGKLRRRESCAGSPHLQGAEVMTKQQIKYISRSIRCSCGAKSKGCSSSGHVQAAVC